MISARTFAQVMLTTLLTATAGLLSGCPSKPGSGTKTTGAGGGQKGTAADSPAPTIDPSLIAEHNKAVGLMSMFNYGGALDIFSRLATDHPDWLDVRVNQAIALLNLPNDADQQQALVVLAEVLQRDPGHLRARFCSGLLRMYMGEQEVACGHFRHVADHDPRDAYAAYYVAQCLEEAGNLAEATRWYQQALAIDGYLRSPYNRLAHLARRQGDQATADQFQEAFNRLERNPRARLVEFKYTRMGPKSEALAIDAAGSAPSPRPPGDVLAEPRPLAIRSGGPLAWRLPDADHPPSVTACDIDGDGAVDLFISGAIDGANGAGNAVLLNRGAAFELAGDHPLARVSAVNAALWGDFDNDGLTDVYLCRCGPNQLWQQSAKNQWQDVTEATGTGGGGLDTVDGAIFDADHDGDLDIFCVNADGPNELFNNNLDGTFRPIAQAQGIAGAGGDSRQVLPVDLDGDRDLDLIVLNSRPPHDAFLNDRMWSYQPAAGLQALIVTPATAIVAADFDADGQTELLTLGDRGPSIWRRGADGQWTAGEIDADRRLVLPGQRQPSAGSPRHMAVLDLSGDGSLVALHDDGGADWTPILLDPRRGPAFVAMPSAADASPRGPILWEPGSGRHAFTAVTLTGRVDPSGSPPARSNTSGIGARVVARVDSQWTILPLVRAHSGPGQSLQPLALGLAGHQHLDYISIDWPDGVLQSEVHGIAPMSETPPRQFTAGRVELIEEIQRQQSSCPVLFVWDGTDFAFVSDLLGVGGLGYLVAPHEFAPPRPWENFLLPEGLPQPRDGQYIVKLTEPMEETCYLDSVELEAHDLPPSWRMTLDERMGISGPDPTGQPRYFRHELLPARVRNDRGEDVTAKVIRADHDPAPPGEIDRRFIGRLAREHVLTIEFDRAIDALPGDAAQAQPMLMADGWIEYPYSQTMFAAWQAGASYDAPTIEALGADGLWVVVLHQVGYPAGMPRQMSTPLPGLPKGTTRLRIRTNQEIMWDRLSVAYAEPCPEARILRLPLISAALRHVGFPRKIDGPHRLPSYEYGRRRPLWDMRRQTGFYTRFGDVQPLVEQADGATATFGPGEEVEARFAGHLPAIQPGWSRRLVLNSTGWCKDMDLYTEHGDTVEPAPGREAQGSVNPMNTDWNIRYESER